MTTIPNQVLTMPLAELRERTELAERLALAARLTPERGQYAEATATVQPGSAATPATEPAPTRRRRTKAEIEAAEAAEKAKAEAAAAAAAPADDDGFVMDDDAGADGGDMILDDDDFVGGEVEPDIDYKAEVIKMAQAIQASKDTAKLSKVRAILTARKVQKITDLPETEMKGLYTEMKAI